MEALRLHDASEPTKAVLMRTALQDAGALFNAPSRITDVNISAGLRLPTTRRYFLRTFSRGLFGSENDALDVV